MQEDRVPGTEGRAGVELHERLKRIVTSRTDNAFGVSGAVFGIMGADGSIHIEALGVDAAGTAMSPCSYMPIASASKLATGLLILILAEQGALDLDAEIGTYLPEAAAAKVAGVTIRRLLSHTSGLPVEYRHELSEPMGSLQWREGLIWPGDFAGQCLEYVPELRPGTLVQYSNLAFNLLGLVSSRVTARPLADDLDLLVFRPLKVQACLGRLPSQHVIQVADVPSPYAGTSLEPYNGTTARLSGAPATGVLTNAEGLLKLVRAYAPHSSLLSEQMSALARSDHAAGLSGGFTSTEAFIGHLPPKPIEWTPCPWGLSIELQGGKAPHWAPQSMPTSFGQIGSSGCLAWHDPETQVSWALMGARTTYSGWLVRHGARIAQSALQAASGLSTAARTAEPTTS
jgi:CubicO group peptidase (beta-lactamase class C family)